MCFIEPIIGRDWQGRFISDSQRSYNSEVIFMWKQVCSSEKDHFSSVRSTAGDGGISDTRKHSGCIVSIKATNNNVSVALRALTLAHCVG